MNDNLKLIITVLPEIIVFMGIGLFIKATKKLEVLTIPGLNVYNLSEPERKIFANSFFVRMLCASSFLIVVLIILEILMFLSIIQFETCVKIIIPIIFIVVTGLVFSLISLSQKHK